MNRSHASAAGLAVVVALSSPLNIAAAEPPAWIVSLVEDVSMPSTIVAIAPDGSQVWSAQAGMDPDIVAPPGSPTVWVLDTDGAAGRLRALDAATGDELARTQVLHRVLGTLPPTGPDPVADWDRSVMFVPQMAPLPPVDAYTLAILDADSLQAMARLPLPVCPGITLLPGHREAVVLCASSARILRVTEGADGGWRLEAVEIADPSIGSLIASARLPNGDIAVLTNKLHVLRLDTSGAVVAGLALDAPKRGAAPDAVVVSTDGATVWIGLAEAAPRSAFGFFELVAIDTASWGAAASSSLPRPMWSMSSGADGGLLTVDRTAGSVWSIDPITLALDRQIDVGPHASVVSAVGVLEP